MTRSGERGSSRLSTLFWLLVLAALVYAAWNAGPAYVANFRFKDSLEDIARLPPGPASERAVQERIDRTIRELELREFVAPGDCKASMEEMSRTITCDYSREVQFLPGYRRTVLFRNKVRQSVF
jgi:hypothetical protein